MPKLIKSVTGKLTETLQGVIQPFARINGTFASGTFFSLNNLTVFLQDLGKSKTEELINPNNLGLRDEKTYPDTNISFDC